MGVFTKLFTGMAKGTSRLLPFIILGVGVWMIFWGPIQYIYNELGMGWSIAIGAIILYVGYKLFKIKVL